MTDPAVALLCFCCCMYSDSRAQPRLRQSDVQREHKKSQRVGLPGGGGANGRHALGERCTHRSIGAAAGSFVGGRSGRCGSCSCLRAASSNRPVRVDCRSFGDDARATVTDQSPLRRQLARELARATGWRRRRRRRRRRSERARSVRLEFG